MEMADEATAERCLRKINGKSLPGASPVCTVVIRCISLSIVVAVVFKCLPLTAHKVQVKQSHLWKTRHWVSENIKVENEIQHYFLIHVIFLNCFLPILVRCILYLWAISLQTWTMECFMSSFTIVTLPVGVEKLCWTAWATLSEYQNKEENTKTFLFEKISAYTLQLFYC